jgi:hypothetical protein
VRSTTFLFITVCTSIQNFGEIRFQIVPVAIARRRATTSRRAEHRERPRARHAPATPASPSEPRRAPSQGATRTEASLKSAHTPVERPYSPVAHRAMSCGPSPASPSVGRTYQGWAPYSGVKPGPLYFDATAGSRPCYLRGCRPSSRMPQRSPPRHVRRRG